MLISPTRTFKLVFFPVNTTSLTQPMDHGVVRLSICIPVPSCSNITELTSCILDCGSVQENLAHAGFGDGSGSSFEEDDSLQELAPQFHSDIDVNSLISFDDGLEYGRALGICC